MNQATLDAILARIGDELSSWSAAAVATHYVLERAHHEPPAGVPRDEVVEVVLSAALAMGRMMCVDGDTLDANGEPWMSKAILSAPREKLTLRLHGTLDEIANQIRSAQAARETFRASRNSTKATKAKLSTADARIIEDWISPVLHGVSLAECSSRAAAEWLAKEDRHFESAHWSRTKNRLGLRAYSVQAVTLPLIIESDD
jgi:hypothetical protein